MTIDHDKTELPLFSAQRTLTHRTHEPVTDAPRTDDSPTQTSAEIHRSLFSDE
ncbi:hypothetical protein SIM91_18230 [Rhodococcus opacus]|uniref:hypothetical protein n=1 Tax=Rhodococcus opacus TaxID=37919 RepID=UPI0002A45379|nr:hypothetical protein [Rhodococcus opacus]ELB85680.1 hypothetical protein Rwratislav_48884 [Rhodococcus wratislaviensis IFP 2016]MDX5965213.1 hypothetical protein [Rhodococcus opacus]NKY74491.1 hypothetical protein [Rhodococcus opacus]CAG7619520.1 hypothetical protein E143388_06176 [Rhodococcus opacus]